MSYCASQVTAGPMNRFTLHFNRMSPLYNMTTRSRIHPSYAPCCTHAYALSLSGAHRFLQHLRYPPFSFSRALDHAFSWLIESQRLRAFSIVPSVVAQRKVPSSGVSIGRECVEGASNRHCVWNIDFFLNRLLAISEVQIRVTFSAFQSPSAPAHCIALVLLYTELVYTEVLYVHKRIR